MQPLSHPLHCRSLAALCGYVHRKNDIPLGYKGSPFHRIIKDFMSATTLTFAIQLLRTTSPARTARHTYLHYSLHLIHSIPCLLSSPQAARWRLHSRRWYGCHLHLPVAAIQRRVIHTQPHACRLVIDGQVVVWIVMAVNSLSRVVHVSGWMGSMWCLDK